MERQQIFELLAEILVTEFDMDRDQLSPAAQLSDDLDLDSIDAIDIAVRLEEATGLRVADSDLEEIDTLQDVVDLVHSGLAARSG